MAYKNPLLYFYLDGQLHKWIQAHRGKDQLIAWKYSEMRRVHYSYTAVKKHAGRAFTAVEVGEMLGRKPDTVKKYIQRGNVRRPQAHITQNKGIANKFLFSEENVYEIHDYILQMKKHQYKGLPSRAELRAMMKHDIITYVKNKEGEFVPVWKETDW